MRTPIDTPRVLVGSATLLVIAIALSISAPSLGSARAPENGLASQAGGELESKPAEEQPTLANPAIQPAWFTEHMAWMVQHSPLKTDNAKYKSDQEPVEAYVTEWSYGPGKQSLQGRLFGLQDGCPTGDFWSFRLFWNPHTLQVQSDQLGAGGAYGVGAMTRSGEKLLTEQVFAAPGAPSWDDRHEIAHSGDTQTTGSYKKVDGQWVLQRSYDWSGPAELKSKRDCG